LFRCAVPPTLVDDVDEYTAVVDGPVELSCDVAAGLPVPAITWYRDGVEVTWSGHVMLASGALRIESVSANDSGVYECRAVNDAGAASRHVTLTVHRTYRHCYVMS